MSELTELLHQCTAQVNAATSTGSGFFVAPGKLVTCAHVVKSSYEHQQALHIVYQGRTLPADIVTYTPSQDLALLAVPNRAHPCVYLAADLEVRDALYAFGYPGASIAYGDYRSGDSLTVEYEGPSTNPPLLKLKAGQIVPGFSGSPILNIRTGTVCGMLTLTRDDRTNLGGRAISVSTILSQFASLAREHEHFHAQNDQWRSLMPKVESASPADRPAGSHQIINNWDTVDTQTVIGTVHTLKIEK